MSSVFLLCEQAVGLVRGKRLILSTSEKNNLENFNYEALTASHSQDEAVVCALHFESVRDSLLQLYPWIFAKKTENLPQLKENGSGWRYSFLLPSDCLKVSAVITEDKRVDFYEAKQEDISEAPPMIELLEYETTGEYLYSNRTPVILRYQAKITDISKWDLAFTNLFIIKLAQAIAGAIRADASVVQGLENNAAQIIQAAIDNGLIKADTGLQLQRETRPISELNSLWLDYSGVKNNAFNASEFFKR